MTIRHPILLALQDVTRELRQLVDGESCDHKVGICWCETFRALNNAEAILRRNEQRDEHAPRKGESWKDWHERQPYTQEQKRIADHIDGYDRDDLGESPDF